MTEVEPRESQHIFCRACGKNVVWLDSFTDHDKYRIGSLARGSPLMTVRLLQSEFGYTIDDANALMWHVTRQRGKCQRCGGDVPRGVSICELCRAANADW